MTDAKPFPSYKHSGQRANTSDMPIWLYGVADGCCNSCVEYQCRSNFVASYDTEGEILVPTENNMNWTNEAPPGEVHTIPCAYTVTVGGVSNYAMDTSWCQSCGNLNGSYYMRLLRAPAGQVFSSNGAQYDPSHFGGSSFSQYGHIQCMGVIPLCGVSKPISYCGFSYLTIFLMIGHQKNTPEWWIPYDVDAITQGSPEDGVYRNDNREADGRPQLKIYGVAYFTPPSYGEDVYIFITELGDFNGDYKYRASSGGIVTDPEAGPIGLLPFADTKEGELTSSWWGISDVPTKVYHGDYDGRNLTFTINGSDRVGSDSDSLICNMSGMTIGVAPLEDEYPETVDSTRPFRGFLSEDFGNVNYVTDIITDTLEGQTWVDGTTGEIRDVWPGYGFLCNSWTLSGQYTDSDYNGGNDYYNEHGRNAPIPEVMYVTISGTTSTNPDNEDKYACNDAEDLNGQHALQIIGYAELSGWLAGYYVYFRNPVWWKTLENRLCCQCNRIESACISAIRFQVDNGAQSTTVKVFVMRDNIVLARYEKEFGHTDPLTVNAIDGATLDLAYTDEDYADEVTFGSTVTIQISSPPDHCDCLLSRECNLCATETQHAEVIATPSDELTLTNVCTQDWGCDDLETLQDAGVGEEAVLSLGSETSGLIYATNAGCSWINTLYLDVETVPGIGTFVSKAWYEFSIRPLAGEHNINYPFGGINITYEDVMLLEFFVVVLNESSGSTQKFYGVYHDTVPLNSWDDIRYWMDCNFNHTLNWVGWTFYGSFSPYHCCYPKIGDSVTITIEE